MDDSPIPGYITKKEAEAICSRSARTMTRDMSKALRVRNMEVLKHIRLRTNDGEIRPGTEVTLDLVQDLSNRGLGPTWYVDQNWVATRYEEDESDNGTAAASEGDATPTEAAPVSQVPASDATAMLREQIADLKADKEMLYEELQIKNEQLREANERTREQNVLMKQFQELIGDLQRMLPSPTQESSSPASEFRDVDARETPLPAAPVGDTSKSKRSDSPVIASDEKTEPGRSSSNEKKQKPTPQRRSGEKPTKRGRKTASSSQSKAKRKRVNRADSSRSATQTKTTAKRPTSQAKKAISSKEKRMTKRRGLLNRLFG